MEIYLKAGYDEAKNEQAFIEGRIIQPKNTENSKSDNDEDMTDKVSIGARVRLKVMDEEYEDEVEYTLVGSAEADPINMKISNESPVGKAILGKKANDTVEIQVPDGIIKYKILQINK